MTRARIQFIRSGTQLLSPPLFSACRFIVEIGGDTSMQNRLISPYNNAVGNISMMSTFQTRLPRNLLRAFYRNWRHEKSSWSHCGFTRFFGEATGVTKIFREATLLKKQGKRLHHGEWQIDQLFTYQNGIVLSPIVSLYVVAGNSLMHHDVITVTEISRARSQMIQAASRQVPKKRRTWIQTV